MSSNQNRRVVPFRRRVEYNTPALLTYTADPQSGRSLGLAGDLGILSEGQGSGWAPWYAAGDMLRAVLSDYRLPEPLWDLILNSSHRIFYQGLHHYTDELYASSPSFLISAGGFPTTCAYPVAAFANTCPPQADNDFGVALPTTVMPTARFIDRDDLVRFEGSGSVNDQWWNLCVAPNFACGLNPVIPASMSSDLKPQCVIIERPWTFINFSGECNNEGAPFGFFLAVFQWTEMVTLISGDVIPLPMGFLEAFDTKVNSNLPFISGSPSQNSFVSLVLRQNQKRSHNRIGINKYITFTGDEIEFTISPRSEIVSINGATLPGSSRSMAFGDIVDSEAQSGVMTITDGYTGQALTLDYHDPSARPVPHLSPVPPFTSATCLRGFVWRHANNADMVCVTTQIRDHVAQQNSFGPSRQSSGMCLPGFVPRGANAADNVCATPADRAQAGLDNLLAPSRRAIP
jgi:hypothetical protein